jgi:hypothetical protein
MWKVAAAGKQLQKRVVQRLANRFHECISEKNCALIRYDIIEVFRRLYDEVKDEKVKEKALELIETEKDLKYRKKYAGLWRSLPASGHSRPCEKTLDRRKPGVNNTGGYP